MQSRVYEPFLLEKWGPSAQKDQLICVQTCFYCVKKILGQSKCEPCNYWKMISTLTAEGLSCSIYNYIIELCWKYPFIMIISSLEAKDQLFETRDIVKYPSQPQPASARSSTIRSEPNSSQCIHGCEIIAGEASCSLWVCFIHAYVRYYGCTPPCQTYQSRSACWL